MAQESDGERARRLKFQEQDRMANPWTSKGLVTRMAERSRTKGAWVPRGFGSVR
jgi:hypothetical protein